MTETVYLDHNATTPVDPRVLEAMPPWLRTGFGNPSSNHLYGKEAKAAVEAARAWAPRTCPTPSPWGRRRGWHERNWKRIPPAWPSPSPMAMANAT